MKQIIVLALVSAFTISAARSQSLTPCNFDTPALEFKSGSCTLTANTKEALEKLAGNFTANTGCIILVTTRAKNKALQQLAACRHDAIKKYLNINGIAEAKIRTRLDKTQDSDKADITISDN